MLGVWWTKLTMRDQPYFIFLVCFLKPTSVGQGAGGCCHSTKSSGWVCNLNSTLRGLFPRIHKRSYQSKWLVPRRCWPIHWQWCVSRIKLVQKWCWSYCSCMYLLQFHLETLSFRLRDEWSFTSQYQEHLASVGDLEVNRRMGKRATPPSSGGGKAKASKVDLGPWTDVVMDGLKWGAEKMFQRPSKNVLNFWGRLQSPCHIPS